MTIKQLNEAEQVGEKDFKIDNAQISQVRFPFMMRTFRHVNIQKCTLVAQVRNISQQTTNITYKLDDGTGTIEVKVWNDRDNNDESPKEQNITENSYVRVWGRLHSMGNKRYIGAHIIRPIADFNEINYHLLEATAVHLYFIRGPPLGSKPTNEQRDVQMNNSGYGGDGLPAGLSATATKVYRCLETTPQSNEGLHQQDIASRLGMDINEVIRGGDQLMELGLIYSTVDESTWALLNMA